mgnify:CR=1 FL=1
MEFQLNKTAKSKFNAFDLLKKLVCSTIKVPLNQIKRNKISITVMYKLRYVHP